MIGIVEDTKALREDLERACKEVGWESMAWRSYGGAKKALLGKLKSTHAELDLLLIDCCLIPRDSGRSTGGITLARELCRSSRFRGIPIYMYTKFGGPGTPVRDDLEALLDEYKANNASDVSDTRRIINPDLQSCAPSPEASALLRAAVQRKLQLGV